MGHPVAHDGQQLLRVVDGGGDQQVAVGVGAGDLAGQQIAPGEVVRDGGGHAQGGFHRLLGKPDVGLPLQVGKVLGLRGEARVLVHAQRFDAGDAEVFELLRARFCARFCACLRACLCVQLGGGQVPDAVFMNQAVRVRLARLALVDELAGAVLPHGCLQLLKGAALPAQVFFRHGLHVQAPVGGAGFDLPDQPGQAGVGEQCGNTYQLAVFASLDRKSVV